MCSKQLMRIKNKLLIILFVMCLLYEVSCCRNGGIMLKYGLKPNDKHLILEEHNRLRQAVAQGLIPGQPGAQNMQEIRWDDELAERAQQWANECFFKHDPKKHLGRFDMGQNIAMIWSTAPLEEDDGDFPTRIRKWFDEVKKYSYGNKWSLSTGHYMQLIWSESSLVGCGYSNYYTGNKFNKLFVCNYGPGGNIEGLNPYATGRASCEHYGLDRSISYPGLCIANTDSSHHENVIPQNYYSYHSSANENQHYTSASTYNTHSNQNYDNHILYNVVFDQHKQQHQTYQHPPQIYAHPLPQAPPATTAFVHKPPPYISTYSQKQHAKPNNSKSPFLTYRWDLLFNLLHP